MSCRLTSAIACAEPGRRRSWAGSHRYSASSTITPSRSRNNAGRRAVIFSILSPVKIGAKPLEPGRSADIEELIPTSHRGQHPAGGQGTRKYLAFQRTWLPGCDAFDQFSFEHVDAAIEPCLAV